MIFSRMSSKSNDKQQWHFSRMSLIGIQMTILYRIPSSNWTTIILVLYCCSLVEECLAFQNYFCYKILMKHVHYIANTFERYGNLTIITFLSNSFEYTLCSWIHPHSWKSLVCLQRQERRMDTIPFSMTSRTLNFILVFQHIILNRQSERCLGMFCLQSNTRSRL